MIYTQADIEAHITPDRFNKGWELFTDGLVTAPNIQRGGELVTAVIPQAGGRRPLRVYVRTGNNRDSITINGQCSCGQQTNCEHVAAVMLQALEDHRSLPDAGNTSPLAIRDAAPAKSTSEETAGRPLNQQALLFFLYIDEDGLLVETSVARRLLHGGYSLVRRFEPRSTARHTQARFLEPADLELLSALEQLPRAPVTSLPILDGPHSAHILQNLLASGRCYLENSFLENSFLINKDLEDAGQQAPLKIGPPRPIEFQWLMDDFGYQRIVGHTIPEADTLLPLSSPWYLDSEKSECGPVDAGMPMDLINDLMLFPPVAPEQVQQAHKALLNAWPDAHIPPLQHLMIETVPRVKPVPCLRLTTVEDQLLGDWREVRDMACLRFDYSGDSGVIILGRHTPSTHLIDGRLIRVQRDKKAEQAAVKQLRKRGFEEDEDWRSHSGEDSFVLEPKLMDSEAQPWLDFQVAVAPTLRAQGWHIDYDNFRFRLTEATNWICDVDKLEQRDEFSIGLGVEVDGQRIDMLPVLLDFMSYYPRGLPDKEDIATQHFVIPFTSVTDGEPGEERLLHLSTERVLSLLEILREIFDGTPRTEKPIRSKPRSGKHGLNKNNSDKHKLDKHRLRFNRVQLARLTALELSGDGPSLHWLADEDIQQLARRLRNVDGIPEVDPPMGLMAELRPYQQQGLNWLQFLREFQLAGILADDMGLGKTVQTLAHLLVEKEAGRADRPSLVIAPTSLMFNWRHEAQRFAPQLKVLVLHGPQRKEHLHRIAKYDLVITTYPLLARDTDALLKHQYHLLILDEAQVIKNPKARASQIVRAIDARHRLCLTGTPLENHLGELWSLFDFLLPGLLGDSKQFRRFFRTPIENHGNEAVANRLSCRIRPFLLRRTKQQVATELPEKTEIIQSVALEDKQRELYETVRLAMHRRVREEIERQGLARSHIVVLDALLKLRQVCCDPRLLKTDKTHPVDKNVKQSAKLDMLMELLPEMIEEGRRILVFSQFTTMLELIEEEVKKAGITYATLTGQTRDRQTPVQSFQNGEVPLFLISLKAGGVGLNLTAADTVIHYDPWWNPAVERQATDRAHRIGQQRAVFVYKLICEGTLEEKIHAMQQRKQALADGLYQSGESNEPQWDEKDLEALFGPLQA